MDMFRALLDLIPVEEPGLWRLVYPRAYRDTGIWNSPKIAAVMLANSARGAMSVPLEMLSGTDRSVYIVACKCVEHQMPTYFVSRALMDAVAQTSIPRGLEWDKIPLPYPGMTVVLPRGTLMHRTEGEIGSISFAKTQPHEEISFPYENCPARIMRDGPHLIAVGCAHGYPTMPIYSAGLNRSDMPTLDRLQDMGVPSAAKWSAEKGALESIPTTVDDAEIADSLISLAMRIVLVINARPGLIELGIKTGVNKQSDGGSLEYWTPTVVGRTYRAAMADGTPIGSHASPRMHWRRGHYTSQPYGPQHSLRKILWLEPCLVGADA